MLKKKKKNKSAHRLTIHKKPIDEQKTHSNKKTERKQTLMSHIPLEWSTSPSYSVPQEVRAQGNLFNTAAFPFGQHQQPSQILWDPNNWQQLHQPTTVAYISPYMYTNAPGYLEGFQAVNVGSDQLPPLYPIASPSLLHQQHQHQLHQPQLFVTSFFSKLSISPCWEYLRVANLI